MKKILKNLAIIIPIILCLIGIGSFAYIQNYYHAEDKALQIIENPPTGVRIEEMKGKKITFIPEEIKAGFIFYPGGKVQYESYAPLMSELAERGILCILVHMPGNLAVLNKDAADGIQAQWPEVKNWYMGGHSLGGVMASAYLEKHSDEYKGLVLLASYSANDLSQSGLEVLAIYGSEDRVMGLDQYEEARANLPENITEKVIQGGCHAYFGCYGPQKGDGNPSISQEEQWNETAGIIEMLLIK